MTDKEIIKFVKEQQEIFSPDSKMGEFLQTIKDKIGDTYKPGDFIWSKKDNIHAVVLDGSNDSWIVLTENGCVETVSENDFCRVGHTQAVDNLVKELQKMVTY